MADDIMIETNDGPLSFSASNCVCIYTIAVVCVENC